MKRKRNSLVSKQQVDRISKLPDELIHQILSTINMRRAVRTSVLSKRWRNIWRSLPFITLSCATFIEDKDAFRRDEENADENLNRVHNRFAGFMDNVFDFRDKSDLRFIKLGCYLFDYKSVQTLDRWILAAVSHNVQVVIIVVHYLLDSKYEIPHQLLNCKSLKSLTIRVSGDEFTYTEVVLPKSMSLPQLKQLSLEGISVSSSELQRLFLSCPLLEIVSIQDCEIQRNNQRNIIIDSPSLQSFDLTDTFRTHVGSPTSSLTCTTKIYAPNVKIFRCTGFMAEDFSLENLSSPVAAHLNMRYKEKEADETAETYSELLAEVKEVFAERMMKYLGAVNNVHHLTLSSGFLEVLLQAPGTLYRQPPQLCNLETMKLEMRFTRGCLQAILYLLKISPTIRTLILISKESNLPDVGGDWEAEFSWTCMFPHLKSIEIREVEGCDNELKFLTCLLKRTMVLENLNLICRSTSDSDGARQVRRFKRNVRALPAPSSSMELKFC